MDVSTLKSRIVTKDIPSFLIFAGDEWKVQQIYIDQICKATNKQKQYIDSVESVFRRFKSVSLVNDTFVYVVRDDHDLMQNEALQKQIKDGALGDNILILLLSTVDKRTKLYKAFSDVLSDFSVLDDRLLAKYIKCEIALSERATEHLINICEKNYGRILLEIDKVRNYAQAVGTDDYNEVLENLITDGTIYQPPEDAIFQLVDSILDRRVKRTYELLDNCKRVGESPIAILSVLFNNVKAVLQVQTCNSKDISKSTGLTPWLVKCARQHVGRYADEDLIYILQKIQQVDNAIKSGTMEEQFAIDYLLVKIL